MRSSGAPPPEGGTDPGHSSDDDQALDDREQTLSEGDQRLSDRDQTLSDREQEASGDDQAASDRDREHGVDSDSRARTSALRAGTARERLEAGQLRDEPASERDQAAEQRDEVAGERDRDADRADQRALELDARDRVADMHTLRVQELRGRGREVGKRAALDRERAGRDRGQSARDRELGARDRELGARDREHSKQDRDHAATDELTGAYRRGVGLEELEREIARARRTGQTLVAAYVDVDGLKAVNDTHGHSAGDELLRHVAESLRHRVRTYDLLVRLGGDEFLCVLPGVSVDEVRRRFHDLESELPAGSTLGSVSIGLSELRDGENAQELINRADRNLLAGRSE